MSLEVSGITVLDNGFSIKDSSSGNTLTLEVPNYVTNNITVTLPPRSSSITDTKVKKFMEPIQGGRYTEDCFVFIDTDDNVRFIGANNESKFGTQATMSYKSAPSGTLWLPYGVIADKVYVTSLNVYILATNGDVYVSGDNSQGQCGDGTTTDVVYPKKISSLSNVVKIAVSNARNDTASTAFLTSDWNVYTVGNNYFGQLGDGTTTTQTTPVLVLGPDNGYGNPTTTVSDIISSGGLGRYYYIYPFALYFLMELYIQLDVIGMDN